MSAFIAKWSAAIVIALILILLLGATAGISAFIAVRYGAPAPAPVYVSTGPTIIQLQGLSELTTTRIHIVDVLTGEGETHRGSWIICGDALVGCDLSKCQIIAKDDVKRIATIRLPFPRVISSQVDHEKTKTWNIDTKTWIPWKWDEQSDLQDGAMHHAQKLIEFAAADAKYADSSKAQAEVVIRNMYDLVGWQVSVEWEPQSASATP